MRILIVDDDKEIIEMTTKTLIDSGCKIDIAYDGREALEKIKRNRSYDLLILAILIPKVSGIEICQQMTQDEILRKVPVILCSVLPLYSEVFQRSLMEYGEFFVVKGLLQKPFSPDYLLTEIRRVTS